MNVFDLSAKITMDINGYLKGMDTAKSVAISTMGVIGGQVSEFMGKSIEVGKGFDSSMSQVAATMGGTMQTLATEVGQVDTAFGTFDGNLREYAQFMGKNTAFSATQAADALNYMALAGYDTQKSMEMLPNVMSLAAAGGFDLARASDMVTDTQTAFGLSTSRTTQMVDEMAKAASTGNTSVEQLGDAFLVVGGLAKELNGGMVTLADGTQAEVDGVQELEIALTAMANAGVKGSEAGTHMRNMLLKLSSPTDAGVKQMTALGVSVFDAGGQMRSLQDIMGDLNIALSRVTQEEKIQAISDLFNTRDMASAEALLAAVGEDWNHIGEEILNAEGAAQQMADVQLDNLEGDITLFNSALEGLQIALSDSATPALREMTQFGTELIQNLTDGFLTLPEPIQTTIGMIGLIGGKVAEVMPQVIGMTGSLAQMADKVPLVGKLFEKLNGFNPASLLNPAFLSVAAAIGVAVAAIQRINDKVSEATEEYQKFKQTTETISASTEEAADGLALLAQEESSVENAAENAAKATEYYQTLLDNQKKSAFEAEKANKELADGISDTTVEMEGLDYFFDAVSGGAYSLSLRYQEVTTKTKDYMEGMLELGEANQQITEELQKAEVEADKWNLLASEMSEIEAQATVETINLMDAQNMAPEAYGIAIDAITELNSAHSEYRGNIEASIEQTTAAMEALKGDYEEARISAYESLSGIFDDFQKMPEIVNESMMATIKAMNEGNEEFDESAYVVQQSVEEMISSLESQAEYMKEYSENIDKAMEMGVDEGLVKRLSDGSTDSAAILKSIVEDGGANIAELNEKFAEVEEGKLAFSDKIAEMQTDFSTRLQEMQDDLDAAMQELDKEDELYQSGMNSIIGYVNGATSSYMQQMVYDNMYKMGQLAHAGFKAGQQEASPSKLFRKSGQNSMLGAILGAEDEARHLERTYENLASVAIDAYDAEMHDVEFREPEIGGWKSNAAKMAASIPRSDARERSRNVYLTVDGQVIGKVLLPYLNAESERLGVQIGGIA